jgi:hypothetical protein
MSAEPKPRALSFVTFLCRRNAQLGGPVNNAGFASTPTLRAPVAPPSIPHPLDGGALLVVFTALAARQMPPAADPGMDGSARESIHV